MEEEKDIRIMTAILLSISTILIVSFLFFFIAVAKVDAQTWGSCSLRFTNGSDIVNGGTGDSATTNFGSATVGGITQNGHYQDINQIQNEVTCSGANLEANKTYRYQFIVRVEVRGLITTSPLLKDYTWQTQIRDSNNITIPFESYNRNIRQLVSEGGQQQILIQIDAILKPTSAVSNVRQVYKTTTSLTSLNAYSILFEGMTIQVETDPTDEIINAMNNAFNSLKQNDNTNNNQTQNKLGQIIGSIGTFANQNHVDLTAILNKLSTTSGTTHSINKSNITAMDNAETDALSEGLSQSAIGDLLGGGLGDIGAETKEEGSTFIEDAWDVVLIHEKIFTMVIILLTLGLMKMIIDR